MYDVIRQSERIGDVHHHQYHHHGRLQSAVNHNPSYHPASFCRTDPHQAYRSLYGVYAADVVIGSTSCANTGGPLLPTAGIYGSNFSTGSYYWAERVPAKQHPKWSKPAIQWDQHGCPTATDVGGAYRRGPTLISGGATSTDSGASGVVVASRPSTSPVGRDSSSLATLGRQQHSTVTSVDDDDDDDVDTLRCGVPASPHSATYQPHSAHANSNVLYAF